MRSRPRVFRPLTCFMNWSVSDAAAAMVGRNWWLKRNVALQAASRSSQLSSPFRGHLYPFTERQDARTCPQPSPHDGWGTDACTRTKL